MPVQKTLQEGNEQQENLCRDNQTQQLETQQHLRALHEKQSASRQTEPG